MELAKYGHDETELCIKLYKSSCTTYAYEFPVGKLTSEMKTHIEYAINILRELIHFMLEFHYRFENFIAKIINQFLNIYENINLIIFPHICFCDFYYLKQYFLRWNSYLFSFSSDFEIAVLICTNQSINQS